MIDVNSKYIVDLLIEFRENQKKDVCGDTEWIELDNLNVIVIEMYNLQMIVN